MMTFRRRRRRHRRPSMTTMPPRSVPVVEIEAHPQPARPPARPIVSPLAIDGDDRGGQGFGAVGR